MTTQVEEEKNLHPRDEGVTVNDSWEGRQHQRVSGWLELELVGMVAMRPKKLRWVGRDPASRGHVEHERLRPDAKCDVNIACTVIRVPRWCLLSETSSECDSSLWWLSQR